jgi:hypothetical protein
MLDTLIYQCIYEDLRGLFVASHAWRCCPTGKQNRRPSPLAFMFFAGFSWRRRNHGATSKELIIARIAALSGAGSLY